AALLALARNRSFAQQCPRGFGGHFQSQIRFHEDTQVWNRASIANMAQLQVSLDQIDFALRGVGLWSLFHLLRLVLDRPRAIRVGTVPAHVSRRILVCGAFSPSALVAEIQLRRFPLALAGSLVTQRFRAASQRAR